MTTLVLGKLPFENSGPCVYPYEHEVQVHHTVLYTIQHCAVPPQWADPILRKSDCWCRNLAWTPFVGWIEIGLSSWKWPHSGGRPSAGGQSRPALLNQTFLPEGRKLGKLECQYQLNSLLIQCRVMMSLNDLMGLYGTLNGSIFTSMGLAT